MVLALWFAERGLQEEWVVGLPWGERRISARGGLLGGLRILVRR